MALRWWSRVTGTSVTNLMGARTEFVNALVGSEICLTPLQTLPMTTVETVAGLLARHGKKKIDEQISRANIAKMLRARDAASRK